MKNKFKFHKTIKSLMKNSLMQLQKKIKLINKMKMIKK